MRIRGERECRDCGTRWSYYATGSVDCPACGSIRSRGLDDERTLHTAGAGALDLSPVREAVDDAPLVDVLEDATDVCRPYVRRDGFVDEGTLRPPDDTHLAARELVHAAALGGRSRERSEAVELYLLDLLAGADAGERPDAGAVPAPLRSARGLAAAETVRAFRREVLAWLDDAPAAREALGRLDQHAKRVAALDGDVPPATAEALVTVAREIAHSLRNDDGARLTAATDRLDGLEETRED